MTATAPAADTITIRFAIDEVRLTYRGVPVSDRHRGLNGLTVTIPAPTTRDALTTAAALIETAATVAWHGTPEAAAAHATRYGAFPVRAVYSHSFKDWTLQISGHDIATGLVDLSAVEFDAHVDAALAVAAAA